MNQELLNVIDNSISAVLWISTNEFQNTSPFFKEFNYLTSGILEKKEVNLEGLYQTQNFDKLLNIALIRKLPAQSALLAAEANLTVIVKDSPSTIVIVHENLEKNLVEKFQKKYKKQTFIEFSLKEDNHDV